MCAQARHARRLQQLDPCGKAPATGRRRLCMRSAKPLRVGLAAGRAGASARCYANAMPARLASTPAQWVPCMRFGGMPPSRLRCCHCCSWWKQLQALPQLTLGWREPTAPVSTPALPERTPPPPPPSLLCAAVDERIVGAAVTMALRAAAKHATQLHTCVFHSLSFRKRKTRK